MPSIVGKRRGKHTYYYLVESARVDGKPRIVSQEYLGTAEEVMAKLAGASSGEPVRSQHKQFGDLAGVWSVLERLNVVEVVDEVAPRYGNAGASVGTYIAHVYRVGHGEQGGGAVLEVGVRGLVGGHRRTPVGEDAGRGVGPPQVLGCDGSTRRRRPLACRGRVGAADGVGVRTGSVGAGVGHDQLRDLHRLDQRSRPDCPARQGETEAYGSAAGRVGVGRDP